MGVRGASGGASSLRSVVSNGKDLFTSRLFGNKAAAAVGAPQAPSRSGQKESVRQRRIAAQVQAVVCRALQERPKGNDLVQRCGLQVENVEMSPDLRRAYVLWKSKPGMQGAAETQLKSMGKGLRALGFRELCLPFSPSILFVEDVPNRRAQEVEAVLDMLKESEGSSQGHDDDDDSEPAR